MTNFKEKYKELKDNRSKARRRIGLINATNHYHRAKTFEDFSDTENRLVCLSGYNGLPDYHHFGGSTDYKQDPVYQKLISNMKNDESIESAIKNSGLKYVAGGRGIKMKKQHIEDTFFKCVRLKDKIANRKMNQEQYEAILNSEGNEWLEDIVIDTHPENKRKIMLELKDFKYNIEKGITEARIGEPPKFSSYTNEQGQEIMRLNYDEKGRIKELRKTNFKGKEFDSSETYSINLDYVRVLNSQGQIEERDSEGKLVRILRE